MTVYQDNNSEVANDRQMLNMYSIVNPNNIIENLQVNEQEDDISDIESDYNTDEDSDNDELFQYWENAHNNRGELENEQADLSDSNSDESDDYDIDVLTDAIGVVGGEVVGRNPHNTVTDLEDQSWPRDEIVRFLCELHTIESHRLEYPNQFNGGVHESNIPALEQIEMIDELLEQYE